MSDQAIVLPLNDCALTVRVGPDGVWLEFEATTGKSACIHVFDTLNHVRITRGAIADWCFDRQRQAKQVRTAKPELPA